MSTFYPADEVFDRFRSDAESGYPGEIADWLALHEIKKCSACQQHFSMDHFWGTASGIVETCLNCRALASSPKWLIFPGCAFTDSQGLGLPLIQLRANNERHALVQAQGWGLYEKAGTILIAVEADKNLAEYEAALQAKGLTLNRKRYPTAGALPANEGPERFANVELMLSRVSFTKRRYGKQWFTWAVFEDPTGSLDLGPIDPWPGLTWPVADLRIAAHEALNSATKKGQRQAVTA